MNLKDIQNIIDDKTLEGIATKNFVQYSLAVIKNRAIPNIYDGLKPVQRRIFLAMRDINLKHNLPPKKSARIVGQTLGLYHPHGDSAVYEAMVRMAQPFNMNIPLIQGQGNFGSIDGDNAASMRYTEARLTKAGELFFKDFEKDVVMKEPNYDDSLDEPLVLPVPFPNILINGTYGIASGLSTVSIPPHDAKGVIDAVIHMVKNLKKGAKTTSKTLAKYIKVSFPTGGKIVGLEDMNSVIKSTSTSFSIRGEWKEEKVGRKKVVVIYSIPYGITKSKILSDLAKVTTNNKVSEISKYRDESKKDIRIVLELKSGKKADIVMEKLYKNTSLETSFKYNIVLIKQGKPVFTNIQEILEEFIKFRIFIVKKRNLYLLKEVEKELAKKRVLMIASENIDTIVKILKASKNKTEAQQNLVKKLKITNSQAVIILSTPLSIIVNAETLKIKKEIEALEKKESEFKNILESKEKLLDEIIKELFGVKLLFASM
jgi:DNA gyrase subunit A